MVTLFSPADLLLMRICHKSNHSFPVLTEAFLLIKVILCYRTPVCQRPVTNHIMLKVTAQDESGNTKNYVYQTFYILFTSFLKKRFAFSESSCIIQTGFSSFESIQTKILEEIEGAARTVILLLDFYPNRYDRIQQQFRHLTHKKIHRHQPNNEAV